MWDGWVGVYGELLCMEMLAVLLNCCLTDLSCLSYRLTVVPVSFTSLHVMSSLSADVCVIIDKRKPGSFFCVTPLCLYYLVL